MTQCDPTAKPTYGCNENPPQPSLYAPAQKEPQQQPLYRSQEAPQQQQPSIYGEQQPAPAYGQPVEDTAPSLQPPQPLGVGGLPQARPYFGLAAEDGIRRETLFCGYGPGPNIPLHWYDGGYGWVTKYFYDHVPRDTKTYEPGKFRCQFVLPDGQLCNHEVTESDRCKGSRCCWMSGADAHIRMGQHVFRDHGHVPPPQRAWSSELFDTEGCLDAFFCAPCHGSRQMMALAGWEDTFHWGWCMFFTFMGLRAEQAGNQQILYYIPPCVYVACLTRARMVALHSIDEDCCTTCFTSIFCSVCSVAQTYRELAASGVWTGTNCGSVRPANYASIGVSSPPINTPKMV